MTITFFLESDRVGREIGFKRGGPSSFLNPNLPIGQGLPRAATATNVANQRDDERRKKTVQEMVGSTIFLSCARGGITYVPLAVAQISRRCKRETGELRVEGNGLFLTVSSPTFLSISLHLFGPALLSP